jgi:hypothetical protein
MFGYVQKIESPLLFNVVLIHAVKKFVEQGNIDKATEYAKFYRLDGLAELQQVRHLFRVRYYAGFNFDNVLRQCVYLEHANAGIETKQNFQTVFNPQYVIPNLLLHELPQPFTVDNLIRKIRQEEYAV